MLFVITCYFCSYSSMVKLQTFVGTTIVVHKSSSALRSSVMMKGKITNSLKPPLIQT